MDIASFNRKDFAKVNIKDPLGNPTDIEVEVISKDSKQYRQKALEISREESDPVRRGARMILATVVNWQNVEYNGQSVEPDSDEAIEMVSEHEWFAEQIAAVSWDRSFFFSKSETD